ncbi:MAG: NAD(P)H-binding protein [Myxococcota bacterium]|nr:NAD(P)H-binding protein [Myxococcota bacterium]
MNAKIPFIAGSTGATGRTLSQIAKMNNIEIFPHVRRKSASKAESPEFAFDLSERDLLEQRLSSCSCVVQLIGTMKKRFSSGDTYQTSDIGTTQTLVDAAKSQNIQHIVLLSSVGTGSPRGSYLKAKAEAERIVRESGISYSIFRPSMFEGDYHGRIPGFRFLGEKLGMRKYLPIKLEELAGAILLSSISENSSSTIFEGENLWAQVEKARDANLVPELY